MRPVMPSRCSTTPRPRPARTTRSTSSPASPPRCRPFAAPPRRVTRSEATAAAAVAPTAPPPTRPTCGQSPRTRADPLAAPRKRRDAPDLPATPRTADAAHRALPRLTHPDEPPPTPRPMAGHETNEGADRSRRRPSLKDALRGHLGRLGDLGRREG